MDEPTEIKYPLDENGEPYYAATHIIGVQGLDKADIDNSLTDLKDKVRELEKLIKDQKKALSDMIGDTGWIEYQVPPDIKNKAVSSGFKCAIREVRASNDLIGKRFVVRSIRLNMSEITEASMQIAQLPTGFITDNQSFIARQNGYRHPITVECLKDGKIMAFVHPEDQGKKNWVYQEFTWLE